jgi:phosphoserine phosphatase RsbU/P
MMLKSELLSLLSRTSDVYSKNLFSMDAIFCEMNEAMQLKFVGARRPLVIIRRGDNPLIVDNQIVKSIKQKDETHLYYLKGCKHSIDIEAKAYSFYCKNIQLENDDKIYLFSDGYSDQMGGRNKKKYGRKALMNYILNNQDIDMKNEKHQLYENFIEFQGEDEQTDDVVVLGINACQDQIQ